MGIRIHKVLGYALIDLEVHLGRSIVTDRRVNPESVALANLFGKTEDPDKVGTIADFVNYVRNKDSDREHRSSLVFLEGQMRNDPKNVAKEISNCIVYDMEFGTPEVLLIMPLSEYGNWRRYDDIIDYMQAGYEDTASINSIKVLDRGIWPWEGWVNQSTGSRLDPSHLFVYRRFRDGLDKGAYTGQDRQDVKNNLNSISKKMGFKDYQDANENLGPQVPDEVIMLCDFLELFKDPMTAYKLKPVIYTYWG